MHGIEADIILKKEGLDKGNAGTEATFNEKINESNVVNINNLVKKKAKSNLPENNKTSNLDTKAEVTETSKRTMKDFCPDDDDIKIEKINKTN